MDIVLSPFVNESLSSSLKFFINEHHCLFVSLHDKCIPKMHFLVYYPERMLSMGPMTKTWTIRHEAKLKRLTKMDNFKNIAYSMANRHQRWLCYERASGNLLYKPIECGPGRGPSKLMDEPPDIGGDLIVFGVYPCTTIFFDPHYHSFCVEVQAQRILLTNLADPNVFHGRNVNGCVYVGLKYFFLT